MDARKNREATSILVVDDTKANLRLLVNILTSQGYKVRPAPNGTRALSVIRTTPIDLILLDINMPGMNGYEVCEQLKADEKTSAIPIIFISALDEVLDKVKAFSLGGVDYITKPFQKEEVLARVEIHLAIQGLQNELLTKNSQLQLENSYRQKAEEALQEVNTKLEEKVKERTAKLIETNNNLKEEIIERKRTEEELRKSEEKYRSLFNDSKDTIFITAPDGQIIDVNPAGLDMFGYTKEEIIHINMLDIYINGKDRVKFQEEIERQGEVKDFEVRLSQRQGKEIDCLLTATVRKDKNVQIVAYQGIVRDITESKRARAELQKLSSAVEQTADDVIITNKEGIIEYVNPAFELSTGYTKEEAMGQTPGIMKSGQHTNDFYEQLWETILSGEVFRTEFINQKKNGEQFYEERTITPIRNVAGEITHFVAVGRDTTERRHTEKLLEEYRHTLEQEVKERTQELSKILENLKATQNQLIVQEKMASLGALTAGIAHEIKNPLNFVNNFAAMSIELAQELQEAIEEQKKHLADDDIENITDILSDITFNATKINEQGKRADSIVRSMLLHSRGKTGQAQSTDLNGLLSETVNLAYHSIRAIDASFDLTIENNYDTTLKPVVVVPQDISRVFLNIVRNACDAMQEKIKTQGDEFLPLLTVTTKNLGNTVEIRIRDNGGGIPKVAQDKIFTPFFSTKPTGEGTGLGLSISFDIIVQGHQGQLDVETVEGDCTEFVISLPK